MKGIVQGLAMACLITLAGCNADDDNEKLTFAFEKLSTVQGERLWQATGLAYASNSQALYLASRETNPENGETTERIRIINPSDGSGNDFYFDQQDYISKNGHVLNNSLYVVGGTRLSHYPLDLSQQLSVVEHGLALSRFGSADDGQDLYIWGGDINEVDSDLIRKWNVELGAFETVGVLSEPRTWSQGEIVDGQLYIFGGQEQFSDTPVKDVVLVYDLLTGAERSIELPYGLWRSFTAVDGQYIYVAGHLVNGEETESVLGRLDTSTEIYEELEFTAAGAGNIHQLETGGDRLFILYGNEQLFAPLSLMSVELP